MNVGDQLHALFLSALPEQFHGVHDNLGQVELVAVHIRLTLFKAGILKHIVDYPQQVFTGRTD